MLVTDRHAIEDAATVIGDPDGDDRHGIGKMHIADKVRDVHSRVAGCDIESPDTPASQWTERMAEDLFGGLCFCVLLTSGYFVRGG